ncbi:6-phospho-beta-glucosidase [Labedella phragmitis]|uniref:6-phospho-beta-glucosidase n=1 Tax=Labedella phragmitis TaxID=2498849 RepID=A0A3S3Z910_9MICO|nr:6-phospho-beta-glucosidase [Labedella phragmitis]RWZ51435.1 6-phospho-beta-glucosidase [Labedella phragmitis]
MKLTIVGGGSTYTPELLDGFARMRDVLPIDEVWLVDPDEDRRGLVAALGRRMLTRAGHPGTIHTTGELAVGAADADAVLFQLRVGGQRARYGDETFPHEACCIGQETTGPGGFAKALRTVPVVLDAAETVRRAAKPDAWIVDFTNPVGIVTRALLERGHRAVGLCNVAIGFQRRYAKRFGVEPHQVRLDHVGLNHLTWERGIHVMTDAGERDMLPQLLTDELAETAESVHMAPGLVSMLGAIPSYYLRYYYAHDEVLSEQLFEPPRAQVVAETERVLLKKYADPTLDVKPVELERRGGAYYSEAAVDVLASLTSDRGDVQVLNVRNDGTLPFLPDDHVIEVPTRVRTAGLAPLPVPELPADIRGLIAHVAEYERLALDAALNGGRERVTRALLAHPLVGQWRRAERLTDLLLEENASYLTWAS